MRINSKLLFLTTIFLVLVLSSSPASAIVVDLDVKHINNGYNLNGASQSSSMNHYCVVTNSGVVAVFGDNGVIINNLVVDNDGATINGAVVSSDGYIFVSTNTGVYKRLSETLEPAYTSSLSNGSVFTKVSSIVTHNLISEDGFVYFASSSDIMKINLETLLVSDVFELSTINYNKLQDFDVITDEEIYFFVTYHDGTAWRQQIRDIDNNVFYNRDGVIFALEGGFQRLDEDHYYIGSNANPSGLHNNIVNSTGHVVETWGYPAVSSIQHYYKTFYIGYNSNTAAVITDSQVEIIATENRLASSSSGTPSEPLPSSSVESGVYFYNQSGDLSNQIYLNESSNYCYYSYNVTDWMTSHQLFWDGVEVFGVDLFVNDTFVSRLKYITLGSQVFSYPGPSSVNIQKSLLDGSESVDASVRIHKYVNTIPYVYVNEYVSFFNFTINNGTYFPLETPEIPDLPDVPEVPTFPDQPSNPITNSSIPEDNSLNSTWVGSYYESVDGAIGGLNSSVYGMMGFGLYPVITFTDSINSINDSADESFSYVLTTQSNTAIVVNSLFNAMPSPVVALFVYYLILMSILLILKGGVQK